MRARLDLPSLADPQNEDRTTMMRTPQTDTTAAIVVDETRKARGNGVTMKDTSATTAESPDISSVRETVNEVEPAVVGVPDIAPLTGSRTRPGGKGVGVQ